MGNKKQTEPDGDQNNATNSTPAPAPAPPSVVETDDFGLPIRKYVAPESEIKDGDDSDESENGNTKWADAVEDVEQAPDTQPKSHSNDKVSESKADQAEASSGLDEVKKISQAEPTPEVVAAPPSKEAESDEPTTPKPKAPEDNSKLSDVANGTAPAATPAHSSKPEDRDISKLREDATTSTPSAEEPKSSTDVEPKPKDPQEASHGHQKNVASISSIANEHGVSEFSHQQLSVQPEEKKDDEETGWQQMPAYARYDMYDDDDRLIAREYDDAEDEKYTYGGLGGAGKGYTRVQIDEDAESATSMDDNTQYLFKDRAKGTAIVDEDDDDTRDAVSQMQATKDLLTEGQRIAYVGVVRLEIANLVKEGEDLTPTKKTKKEVAMAGESVKMWAQKMMIRVYAHMDISEAEQLMIEQLAEHGVQPNDLVPALHANARVHNPMAGHEKGAQGDNDSVKTPASPKGADSTTSLSIPSSPEDERRPRSSAKSDTYSSDGKPPASPDDEEPAEPPPPYEAHPGDEVPEVHTPSQMPSTAKIDIDLRWTVLCDLFLILIADSVYDSRSRILMERVGKSLDIPWVDICKFEKRVTDALEMQQAAEKENWNEDEHMETRRKQALKKRYMVMGLATVGGGLVIGLSAGLLAPVIGAGLAAGFTTIGVAGTGSFLGGVGGAAIITSGAAASGSYIGAKAANRRTGAVKTFEYRPLHNNKRVNLIVTVSGWLTGKVDDVRLPFSTVEPVMGDIYSVLWEPEMLQSMGDTIRILATEVGYPPRIRLKSPKLTDCIGFDTKYPANPGRHHPYCVDGCPSITYHSEQTILSY